VRIDRRTRVAAVVAVPMAAVLFVAGTGYDYGPLEIGPWPAAAGGVSASTAEETAGALERENRRLRADLGRVVPRGTYIVIDCANNRLYLKREERTLLEAVCSSGSGIRLRDREGSREWTFNTPRGVFKVRSKTTNPAWSKPDWAFVEEGRMVPNDPGDRIEYGALGEYALHLGDGYLIHGTLYERLLGRSVTHGCIRLGRDDLKKVFEASSLGTPVYIF
jgi:L,D-transpeptidase YbiS